MERGYIRGDAPRGESDLEEIACFGRQGFAIKGIRAGLGERDISNRVNKWKREDARAAGLSYEGEQF